MSEFPVGTFDRGRLGSLLCRFCPGRSVEALSSIDPAGLAAKGKKLVLLDVDNTLLPWRSETFPHAALDWIAACRSQGFELCILSNTRHPDRLKRLSQQIGVPYRLGRFKPNPEIYLQALTEFGREPSEAVMIGDQIFTDIWGANRAGIDSIWVKPLTSRDFIGTKVSRLGERILRPILRRAMQPETAIESSSRTPSLWNRRIVQQFIKFAMVGGTSMVIDLGIHYVLMFKVHAGGALLSQSLGSWLIESFPGVFQFAKNAPAAAFPVFKVVSAGIAIVNGFYWNRRWTFSIDTPEERGRHFHRYAVVALFGMLWNTLITTGLNNIVAGHAQRSWAVASAVATVIVAFWNFSGTKFWAFRDKKQ